MDIRYEQRPAATGRCDEIALDHVQQESYQSGPMDAVHVGARIALVEAGGDLMLVHEKHNHSVRHEPVRILKNDYGVPLLEGAAADSSSVFASQLAADANAILLTMDAANATGVTVHATKSGAYTAHKSLSEFPQLPLALRDRSGRRRFWRAIRKCQSDGLVHIEEFVTDHRNNRKRFVLTPKGAAAAVVLQSPVPPAHHRSSAEELR